MVASPLPCATSTIARASSSRFLARGHERARADLDVHHQRVEPGGELLRQDRGDDQRQRLDGAGGVADRVEAAVGRRELSGLADDRAAGARARPSESGQVRRRVVAGDRVELVERPARVAEPAPGDHRHGAAAGGDDRRQQQADLVADAAGRVLVERGPGRSTSDQSSTSPECVLWWVKAMRSSAVRPWSRIAMASAPTWRVRERVVGDPADQEAELVVGQLAAVALAPDQLGECIRRPRDEAGDQRRQVGGRARGVAQRLLVAERLVAHALG